MALAKVTYLPGVTPPAGHAPAEAETEAADVPAAEAHVPVAPPRRVVSFVEEPEPETETEPESDPRRASAEARSEKAADRRAARASNVSMSALTRRGHSRWELEKTLTARELEPDEIAAELDRLEGVGLIDDAALAETIVRTQHERKGLGRSALIAELRRKHIDQEHIDAAMEQLDDDSEQTKATELALRRAPQLRSLDHETAKRRLTAFLMRKGYPSGVVRAAVDAALAGGSTSTVRFR